MKIEERRVKKEEKEVEKEVERDHEIQSTGQ